MVGVINQESFISYICIVMKFFITLRITIHAQVQLEPVANVCLTEQCNKTAIEIIENMDLSILPCDNFYQFICGKFVKNAKLPHGSTIISVNDKLEKHTESLIGSYLEKNSSEKKNKPYHKAFKLYRLCEDEDAIETQEVTHLREIIKKIGGWPVVEGKNWNETNWEKAVGELSRLGYSTGIFFDVRITMAAFNYPTIIMLHPMNFPRISYKSVLDVVKVAIKLGANASEDIESSIEDSMAIFDNINHRSTDNGDVDVFTLEDMILEWPSIDWMTYITGYFSIVPTITIKEELFVSANRSYINAVVNFLTETSKSVIMNYIIAQFVEKSLTYLSLKITMAPDKNPKKRTEASLRLRQEYCTALTTYELPRMVEAIFAVNYVDDQMQNEFNRISSSLKNEMHELIRQAVWLDNETMKYYTEKLSNVTYEIGYPEEVKSNEFIEEYNDLELDERSFLHSMWSMRRFKKRIQMQKIINELSPSMSSSSAPKKSFKSMTHKSGLFKTAINKIVIMPGHFHAPSYNNEVPKYINYGGIGVTIAHELAHGFPSDEKMFKGKRNEIDLSGVTNNEMVSRVDCFINQYNQYFISDLNKTVDGLRTAIENVADNVGVKLAHLAYKNWLSQAGPVSTLPNLNYTPMQMFWISYANNQCTKYNKNYPVNDDPHSLKEFRTNGPLSNNREFSEAFNCPLGSNMNPVNKCLLW